MIPLLIFIILILLLFYTKEIQQYFKPVYRIRHEYEYTFEKNGFCIDKWKANLYFIVEKRILFFIWLQQNNRVYHYTNKFSKYDDAVFEVAKRSGKLIYTC